MQSPWSHRENNNEIYMRILESDTKKPNWTLKTIIMQEVRDLKKSKAYRKQIAKWQCSPLSVITFNVNELNSGKDVDWQNGENHRIQLYVIYRWLIFDPKMQIGWKWKFGKRYSMEYSKQKRAEMAVEILDKNIRL